MALNIIAIMGRLTATPELKKTKNDTSVSSFTIACERNFASGGERKTDFVDIVAWRGAADFAAKYFTRGQLIAVNGRLETRSYEDKNGVKHKVYEIVADNLHFAEAKRDTAPAQQAQAPTAAEQTSVDDYAVIAYDESLPF